MGRLNADVIEQGRLARRRSFAVKNQVDHARFWTGGEGEAVFPPVLPIYKIRKLL